jgi:hypothetical protein
MKVWRETTTSPSGMHLRHHKALLTVLYALCEALQPGDLTIESKRYKANWTCIYDLDILLLAVAEKICDVYDQERLRQKQGSPPSSNSSIRGRPEFPIMR